MRRRDIMLFCGVLVVIGLFVLSVCRVWGRCLFWCCRQGGRGVYVASAEFVLFGGAENIFLYFFLSAFSCIMPVGRGGIAAAPAAPASRPLSKSK